MTKYSNWLHIKFDSLDFPSCIALLDCPCYFICCVWNNSVGSMQKCWGWEWCGSHGDTSGGGDCGWGWVEDMAWVQLEKMIHSDWKGNLHNFAYILQKKTTKTGPINILVETDGKRVIYINCWNRVVPYHSWYSSLWSYTNFHSHESPGRCLPAVCSRMFGK